MTIVCGTDFSEPSSRAVAAAAQLAARTKMRLHLVHTLEVASDDDPDGPAQIFRDRAVERLRREASRFADVAGSVEVHVEAGLPDDALLAVATRVAAKLVVIGVAGRRHGKTALGGHADRIAQRSHVPVLVIRDVAPFEQWARESRPLRVVLGSDNSMSSEAAMRWINELRAFGPCEVIAVHLYWPPEQFHRLGLGGVRSYLDPDPEVTRTLERELAERFSPLPGAGPVKYRLEPHLGRVADRVAEVAAEEKADLVVVGSHNRSAIERLWEGSISRGLLQCARSSAACVPLPATGPVQSVPTLNDVLVATDFSPLGDGAIPFAYATTARGGTVHLIHVVRASSDPVAPHDIFPAAPSGPMKAAFDAARKQLLERVPSDAASRGVMTRAHVLQSLDPAGAICQAAERLAVDLVCLGTHGRTGVAKVVLGSVVQEVLSQSRRPVLVTRAAVD